MTFDLQQLAELCGGTIMGDASLTISGAASLAEATPDEITFYGDSRYLAAFRKTRAAAESRLRAVSRRGKLAYWFDEYGEPD